VKRDLILAGLAGLGMGTFFFAGASALSTRLPIVLRAPLLITLAFGFFLTLSLVEIPLMIVALRQMARNVTTPHRLVLSAFAVFVMFASVYAAMFVLLTGEIGWASVLAGFAFVRLAGGVWVR
jgi:hypothetical protein